MDSMVRSNWTKYQRNETIDMFKLSLSINKMLRLNNGENLFLISFNSTNSS
jgi:hypothetical protein